MSETGNLEHAQEFVKGDYIAPYPGSKWVPNVLKNGARVFARKSVLWGAVSSAHYGYEKIRIEEAMKAAGIVPKNRTIDVGYEVPMHGEKTQSAEITTNDVMHGYGLSPLRNVDTDQWFAMLATCIDKPSDVYAEIKKTFVRMQAHEDKKAAEFALQQSQEVDFHNQLLDELGVRGLVDAARERLNARPDIFERMPISTYQDQIIARVGLLEAGSFDWLMVPIWAQSKIVLSTLGEMAFFAAIMTKPSAVNMAKLKYFAAHQPEKLLELNDTFELMGDIQEEFAASYHCSEVKDEINLAIEHNRLNRVDIERLMIILEADKKSKKSK